MADVESDVMALIEGNGWTEGTDMFRGRIPALGGVTTTAWQPPQRALFVRVISSPKPENYGADSNETRDYFVQFAHRTEPDEYNTGRTDALTLLNFLNQNKPTGYHRAQPQRGNPDHAWQDLARSHVFAFSVHYSKVEAV